MLSVSMYIKVSNIKCIYTAVLDMTINRQLCSLNIGSKILIPLKTCLPSQMTIQQLTGAPVAITQSERKYQRQITLC